MDDDALYWSDDLRSLRRTEDDGYDLLDDLPPDYLFRGEEGTRREFATIGAEMAQLNDYCVLCTWQTRKHLNWLRQELQDLETGRQPVDYVGQVKIAVANDIYTWQNTYTFVTRAMCLLMLSAFTEKSLKSLCLAFAPPGHGLNHSRKRADESEISHYLRFLSETCGMAFTEPTDSVAAREACRRIRNDFAHGDWERVTERVTHVGLRQAFGAVGDLLRSLEAGALQREALTSSPATPTSLRSGVLRDPLNGEGTVPPSH